MLFIRIWVVHNERRSFNFFVYNSDTYINDQFIRMPGSNERHVLAVLRRALHLTQAELADLARCAAPSIESIEILRLKLSPSLAARIALATGCDLDWLLENDISKPMPPIRHPGHETDLKDQAHSARILGLQVIFHRLFVAAAREPRSPARRALEIGIGSMLDALKKIEGGPLAEPGYVTSAWEFLIKYPDLIDPDLRSILDPEALKRQQEKAPANSGPVRKSRGPKFSRSRPLENGHAPPRRASAKAQPRPRSKRNRTRQ